MNIPYGLRKELEGKKEIFVLKLHPVYWREYIDAQADARCRYVQVNTLKAVLIVAIAALFLCLTANYRSSEQDSWLLLLLGVFIALVSVTISEKLVFDLWEARIDGDLKQTIVNIKSHYNIPPSGIIDRFEQ